MRLLKQKSRGGQTEFVGLVKVTLLHHFKLKGTSAGWSLADTVAATMSSKDILTAPNL